MTRKRRWNRAPWALAAPAALGAGLTFAAVPMTWLLLPLLVVVHGAGVLLIREAVVRTGGGWPSLVLLGVAYQIAKDGLGLQALTSPRMYGAADWGWRALGVNWSYWESQIGVHVTLGILVPIGLANLLFPARRARPYLDRGGLLGAGALAIAGVAGLRLVVSAIHDPGYQTPWAWTLTFLVLIAVLALLALVTAPRHLGRRGQAARARTAPRPGVVGFVSLYLTMAFLTTLLPLGLAGDLLFGDLMSPLLRVVMAAMAAVPFGLLVLRWQGAANWTDRHRLWLCGGILVSHTAFMVPGSLAAVLASSLALAATVYLLILLGKHIEQRGPETAPLQPVGRH